MLHAFVLFVLDADAVCFCPANSPRRNVGNYSVSEDYGRCRKEELEKFGLGMILPVRIGACIASIVL